MVKLVKRICLEARYLDSDIMKHILENLKLYTKNECNKTDGYILSVNKILKVINISVSAAKSDIVCTVAFDAEILKPEINSVFKGEVCMIYEKGIFLNVKDKLKVLVTDKSLGDYKFSPDKTIFIKSDKDSIKKGDILSVKITGVQYSKKNYNCFGILC
jgi:DNA-directed RNA polymerase subunit E'/Rpb7